MRCPHCKGWLEVIDTFAERFWIKELKCLNCGRSYSKKEVCECKLCSLRQIMKDADSIDA